jgi:hypothetical protein
VDFRKMAKEIVEKSFFALEFKDPKQHESHIKNNTRQFDCSGTVGT